MEVHTDINIHVGRQRSWTINARSQLMKIAYDERAYNTRLIKRFFLYIYVFLCMCIIYYNRAKHGIRSP